MELCEPHPFSGSMIKERDIYLKIRQKLMRAQTIKKSLSNTRSVEFAVVVELVAPKYYGSFRII